MAFYHDLKRYRAEDADWIARHLLDLRRDLDAAIVSRRHPNSLIVGSWNIRAFDGGRPRRDESYHYIAEIIDKFDICAIQEIKPDLEPLRRLVRLLGPSWDYFVTDVTSGGPGNSERMAFLYNTNRVIFRNLIGELVVARDQLIEGEQISRTPFFASFQASWFRFTLCSAHIAFKGRDGLSSDELRTREISLIANALRQRARQEDEVYIFLGDMNIDSPDDPTMRALADAGFTTPLFGPTNLAGNRHFDQIAYSGEGRRTTILSSGKFDWRSAVYRPDEAAHYRPIAEKMRGEPYANWDRSYRDWTTHEMSDHLPIWIELMVDYSDDYLKRFVAGAEPEIG
ncbi:endonuclease/exonuclease/phosphatase family protein [Oricola thermophila]|uniref:Endonuclease/exonuclease/phosphatase family protein n=1 Tax=Oricola thermophila TaxID=2742145 RepID=A0A6N1VDA1_9HYPH|nr:endonuclease/exonuclease/phosphatase family protein [Oricola thermophila]QKV18880.1 endonuclease/exonuclease/phosphatase family protein [Oricola thermophila]